MITVNDINNTNCNKIKTDPIIKHNNKIFHDLNCSQVEILTQQAASPLDDAYRRTRWIHCWDRHHSIRHSKSPYATPRTSRSSSKVPRNASLHQNHRCLIRCQLIVPRTQCWSPKTDGICKFKNWSLWSCQKLHCWR